MQWVQAFTKCRGGPCGLWRVTRQNTVGKLEESGELGALGELGAIGELGSVDELEK